MPRWYVVAGNLAGERRLSSIVDGSAYKTSYAGWRTRKWKDLWESSRNVGGGAVAYGVLGIVNVLEVLALL